MSSKIPCEPVPQNKPFFQEQEGEKAPEQIFVPIPEIEHLSQGPQSWKNEFEKTNLAPHVNNEGLSTNPFEFPACKFDFNQSYSIDLSNFDYSAECKDLEKEIFQECDMMISDINNGNNIF